jgi:hypothetical protein
VNEDVSEVRVKADDVLGEFSQALIKGCLEFGIVCADFGR